MDTDRDDFFTRASAQALMTKPVRTRKSANERKTQILDTAIALAAAVGPDGLTTERLAREIGISQAAIFRHFATKGEIWMGVARYIGEMIVAKSHIENAEKLKPIAKLRILVEKQLEFINQTPAIPAILFSRELHAKNNEMRIFFSRMMDKRQKLFAGLILLAIERGDIKKSLDPDNAARLILSMIQGLAMRWSLNEHEFDLVKEGQDMLDLLLDGYETGN